MAKLFQNDDGADCQSRAVRAYLTAYDGLECSWSDEHKEYMARVEINRWHNCREQGYVVTMRSKNLRRQINIAFFEHRNSDEICAVRWEQRTLNPPTIDNAEFGSVYKNKYDVSKSVRWGEALKMAQWVYDELESFWNATVND